VPCPAIATLCNIAAQPCRYPDNRVPPVLAGVNRRGAAMRIVLIIIGAAVVAYFLVQGIRAHNRKNK